MGMTPYTSMTNQQTREEVEKGKDSYQAPGNNLSTCLCSRAIEQSSCCYFVLDSDTDAFSEFHVLQRTRRVGVC